MNGAQLQRPGVLGQRQYMNTGAQMPQQWSNPMWRPQPVAMPRPVQFQAFNPAMMLPSQAGAYNFDPQSGFAAQPVATGNDGQFGIGNTPF